MGLRIRLANNPASHTPGPRRRLDTRISDFVLARRAHEHNLVSLTLHERLTSLQLPQPSLAQITYSRILERASVQEQQRSCRICRHSTCSYRTLKPSILRSSGHDNDVALFKLCRTVFARAPSLALTRSENLSMGARVRTYTGAHRPAHTARAHRKVLQSTRSMRSFADFHRRCKRSMSRVPYLTVSWCVLFPFPFSPTNLVETKIARICSSIRPFRNSRHAPSTRRVHSPSTAISHARERATTPDGRVARACA